MPEKASHKELLAFAAILLAAVALRAWNLPGQSFTMDELYDLRLARCDASEIICAADGFPPLYAMLLRGWLAVFPWDMAARWLSVVFGLCSIFFVWRLGRRIGGGATGLWSAAILAVMPIHVFYSQEARAYGLYFLWAAAALWAFFRARDAGPHPSPLPLGEGRVREGDWAVFAMTCLGGLYTHYHFAVLVLILGVLWVAGGASGTIRRMVVAGGGRREAEDAEGAFSVTPSPPHLPPATRFSLLAFAAVAVGALPLLALVGPDLALQVGYPGQTGFGAAQLGYTYFSCLSGFTLGPSIRDLQTLPAGEAIRESLPWLIAIGLGAAPLAYWGLVRLRENRRLAEWLVLLVAGVVVVGVLGNLAHVGYKVRYVVWVAIPLVVLLGAGCGSCQLSVLSCRSSVVGRACKARRLLPTANWQLTTAKAILAAVFAAALYNRHHVDRYRNEDAAGVAAYLHGGPDGNKPVFVISFYMADPVAYYLGEGWDVQYLPDVEAGGDDPSESLAKIDRGVPAGAGYWLVYSRPFHGDPKGTLKGRLTQRDQLRLEASFAGMELYWGQRD
jgi:hypothetical protein